MSIEGEEQQRQQQHAPEQEQESQEEELETSQRERVLTQQTPEPEPPLDPLIKQIKGGLEWYDDPKQRPNDAMVFYPATSKHYYINGKVAPVVVPLIKYYESNKIDRSEAISQALIGQARKLVASKTKLVTKSGNGNEDEYESERLPGRSEEAHRLMGRIEVMLYELYKHEYWSHLNGEDKVRLETVLSHYDSIAKNINNMELSKSLHRDMLYKAKANMNANRIYLSKQDLRKVYTISSW